MVGRTSVRPERSADGVLVGRASTKGGGSIKVTVAGTRMTCRPWTTVSEVKQRLREQLSVPVAWMRLYLRHDELHNGQRLIDLLPSSKERVLRSSSSRGLSLNLKAQNPRDFDSGCYVHAWGADAAAAEGEDEGRLLSGVQRGLAMGLAPQLAWDGTGGTYVLRDTRRAPLAAFKPRDEEPFAPNNPRGFPGKMGQPGIHPFVSSGEAHVREVLAHRLDWRRLATVPLTLQAEAMHPAFFVHSLAPLSRYGAKVGSLQQWVQHDDVASNRGSATFPVHEVHKIALFDMRLLNSDRNDSNILVKDLPGGSVQLIPIDHGGCLPSRAVVHWFDWCWLSWRQMHEPPSQILRDYVAELDPNAETKLISEYGLPSSAARSSRCATLIIQHGVAAGLTLHDIALLLCREDENVPSHFERLYAQAERLVDSALHNHRLYAANACSTAPDGASFPTSSAAAPAAAAPPATRAEAACSDMGLERHEGATPPPVRSSALTSLSAIASVGNLSAMGKAIDASQSVQGTGASPQLPATTLPATTFLRRVSSDIGLATASTPASPTSHADAAGGDASASSRLDALSHENRHGEDFNAAVEATFGGYFDRLLRDEIKRAVKRAAGALGAARRLDGALAE